MKSNLFWSSAVLAMVVGLVTGATAWAKPADLPAENAIQCPDCGEKLPHGSITIGWDLFTGGLTVKVQITNADTEPAQAIDAVLPAYVEQWLLHVGDLLTRPDRFLALDSIMRKIPYVGRVEDMFISSGPETGPQLKGRAIENRLKQPVSLNFKDVPLKRAIMDLSFLTGIDMEPDGRALKDARVDLDTPVTIQVENVNLKAALRLILSPLDLTWMIEGDVLKVTTAKIGRQANAEANDNNRERREAEAARAQKVRASLETRLFEPVNLRIKDVPLRQAIKNLAHVSGVRIVPDYADLKDGRVDLDAPVSLVVENTSLHTALQQLLNPLKLTYGIEDGMLKITRMEKDMHRPNAAEMAARAKNQEAQRLFEIAERHRRSSEYDMARKLYQQVHLLTPTTLHGRMAIDRLVEIEERMRDSSEEQGGPGQKDDPEEVYRDMRDRSIPLGLVEVSY